MGSDESSQFTPAPLVIDRCFDGKPFAQRYELSIARDLRSVAVVIDAPYFADPPPEAAEGRLWKLWEHEVVELFIAGADHEYIELEFGPHGHYLMLRLRGVRQIVDEHLRPQSLKVALGDDRWRCVAVFSRTLLPAEPHRINAYAIHGQNPRTHCAWSTDDARGALDFHRLELFIEHRWCEVDDVRCCEQWFPGRRVKI